MTIAMTMNELARRLSAALYSRPGRDFYLPVLRVYVALHIIKKVVLQWPFLNMLYGAESYAEWSRSIFRLLPVAELQPYCQLLHGVYLAAALLMLFGIGRRAAVAGTCVLCWMFQAWQGYTLNGGDNLLKFLLLYLSFGDSFKRLVLFRGRPARGLWRRWNNLMTKSAVYLILGHQCLIYLISGLAKANAEVWYSGTALYYVLQIDRFAGSSLNQWLIQSPWLIAAATYGTLIWELFFPVLVWLRRARPWVLLAGLAMHAGIYVCMMIHDFEILYVSVYGLYFTNDEWRRFLDRARQQFHSTKAYFSHETSAASG